MATSWRERRGENEVQVIDFDHLEDGSYAARAPFPPGFEIADKPRASYASARWIAAFLPTFLTAIYLFGFAADRYETETQLVIRTAGQTAFPRASGGISLGVGGRSHDVSSVARNFILSRDALATLEARLPIQAMLTPPALDPLYAYPPPFLPEGPEALFGRYLRFVDADVDASSGILTLRVRAFAAQDAEQIAQALADGTEALVNRLNLRPSTSAVEAARGEVERTRADTGTAQQALTHWRAENRMVDPVRLAQSYADTVARLSLELAQVSAQLGELRETAPRSPQAAPLTARMTALRAQIRDERETMAGATAGLADHLGEYERLVLNREFAERSFQSALTVAEVARREAEQQKLFLEQIVRPQRPDVPRYPRMIFWLLAVFVGNFIVIFVARQMIRDAKTHAGD
ncbi:hypothetical protein [Roseococcus pinisoli]|uniref:Capsular polysaccharide transport system permease protein n=1 Tax=Roseococcus pinisoli TaxID=2835040 RepID=A0ABS5QI65_9PROT|nr:hypothetical protein [Roseococcus pinisoli]MBS7813375.1 hypothetical protein [Roseococcus pinisoli]